MKQQRGLGRGLNALLSDEAINDMKDTDTVVKMVDINDIEPDFEQPRKKFEQKELQELSQSILEHGIIQPLVVRQNGDKYQIVAGERRYRAARIAGVNEVPIIIKTISKQQSLEIALIENIQREDLNPMELAAAYVLLMNEFKLTQEEVADKVGKSRSSVANIIRLVSLPLYIQEQIRENRITLGHAKVLLSLKSKELQRKVTDIVIDKALSVREMENYIKSITKPKDQKNAEQKYETNPFYKEIQEGLQKLLGTKVSISKNQKKGKIEIEYYSDEELARILEIINTKS